MSLTLRPTCAMTARCACKKRTRRPRHRRSRRVAPLTAVRVGEATHPGPLSTKHLRCPHCPTWLSHRSSLRNHILRFHEPPPPTPSPVLSEWSFSEADAVEEGKRRRQRGPRSWEARQRRLGRREPTSSVTKNSPSCIPTFGCSSRGSLNSVRACGSWRANRPCYV